MTRLRHFHALRVLPPGEGNRFSGPVELGTPWDLSAKRKQLLRPAWRRSAKTGELQGRWGLGTAHARQRVSSAKRMGRLGDEVTVESRTREERSASANRVALGHCACH